MKSLIKSKPLCCALGLIAACTLSPSRPGWTAPATPQGNAAGGAAAPQGDAAGSTAVMPPDDEARLSQDDTAFGFDLLGKLSHSDGNVFVSPFSVATALSLALNGAGGETRRQISATLHLKGMRLLAVNAANNTLLDQLSRKEPDVTLSIANALWVNHGLTFNVGFEARCHQFYGATSETLDLSSPAGAARINGWVSDRTSGKITGIVTPSDLANATAVLTNAVYFHGRWSQPFDPKDTRSAPFTVNSATTKQVPTMAHIGFFSYLKTDDFQAIRLPYGQGRTAMYILLPNRNDGLDALIASIDARRWSEWIGAMHPEEVGIRLPRFTASEAVTLNRPLSDLGMPDAFASNADFAPMGLPNSPISAVLHKATLEVNEEGSTATAATAVVHTLGMPRFMAVNHPFLCAIRDDATGALLFVGAIRDPR